MSIVKASAKTCFQILKKNDAIYCSLNVNIYVYMMYTIILLLGDDTGSAPWITFIGAVGMMF